MLTNNLTILFDVLYPHSSPLSSLLSLRHLWLTATKSPGVCATLDCAWIQPTFPQNQHLHHHTLTHINALAHSYTPPPPLGIMSPAQPCMASRITDPLESLGLLD